MVFKSNFENDSISLLQIKEKDFEELYLVASNPVVWKQHPDKNRWQKKNFSNFFKKGIQNEFGFLLILDKCLNQINDLG